MQDVNIFKVISSQFSTKVKIGFNSNSFRFICANLIIEANKASLADLTALSSKVQ
jgi:hypothetical protein